MIACVKIEMKLYATSDINKFWLDHSSNLGFSSAMSSYIKRKIDGFVPNSSLNKLKV